MIYFVILLLMLQKFTLNQSIYEGYALKICGCQDKKNDLVNEMYIKLHEILTKRPEMQINNSYVYSIMRSIFIDEKRKKREIYIEDAFNNIEQTLEDDTNDRIDLNNNLDKLTLLEREILLQTSESSLRAVSKRLGRSHQWVFVKHKAAMKKLKKKYNGQEN